MRWFDVGVEAKGVIAIGQHATGVIAIGQVALGVVAVGQLARGVVVVGQLGAGLVTIGQLSLGVAWNAGMVGVGGTSPGWLVLRLLPRWRTVDDSPHVVLGDGTVLSGAGHGRRRRLPPGRLLLGSIGVAVLALVWWLVAGQEIAEALLGPGGVLRPERQLR